MTISEQISVGSEIDRSAKVKMERCVDFIAKMIEKYGQEALLEIEAEEQQKANKN